MNQANLLTRVIGFEIFGCHPGWGLKEGYRRFPDFRWIRLIAERFSLLSDSIRLAPVLLLP